MKGRKKPLEDRGFFQFFRSVVLNWLFEQYVHSAHSTDGRDACFLLYVIEIQLVVSDSWDSPQPAMLTER